MQAEALIKQGKPVEALAALESEVRSKPGDSKLRVFLFQLLCVLGRWERALQQLEVAAQMDAKNLLMAQACRQAIMCEKLREEVFAGKRAPMIVGRPAEWVGLLLQAARMNAGGEHRAASEMRAKALESAPTTSGAIEVEGGGTESFEWIADADSRLGPMLELIVDGRYYWAPFDRIRELKIEKPADLRDTVWAPAQLTWSTAAATVAFVPTRYIASDRSSDGLLQLSRTTDWSELFAGEYAGLGQRVLATDAGEYPLLACRKLTLNSSAPEAGEDGRPADMPVVKGEMPMGLGLRAGPAGGSPGGHAGSGGG
ncbi:MAG: tetratricopeptide repeat protein [Phycisphaerae bacterium]|nr:tetratricopeptide repeat protein [Phycisphaerae bacterium]